MSCVILHGSRRKPRHILRNHTWQARNIQHMAYQGSSYAGHDLPRSSTFRKLPRHNPHNIIRPFDHTGSRERPSSCVNSVSFFDLVADTIHAFVLQKAHFSSSREHATGDLGFLFFLTHSKHVAEWSSNDGISQTIHARRRSCAGQWVSQHTLLQIGHKYVALKSHA